MRRSFLCRFYENIPGHQTARVQVHAQSFLLFARRHGKCNGRTLRAAWKQRRAAREVHPRLEPCAAQVISCRDRIKTSFQSDSVAAVGLYVPHTAGHAGCQRRKEGSLRERRRLAEFVNYAGAIATGRHRRPPRTSLRPNSCMELSQGEARANPKPASMIPPGRNDSPSHVMHPLTVGVVRFIQHGTEQRLRLWLAFQFVLKN